MAAAALVEELAADSVEEPGGEVAADEAGLEVVGLAGELVSASLLEGAEEEEEEEAREVAGLLVSASELEGAAELLAGALAEVLEAVSSVVAWLGLDASVAEDDGPVSPVLLDGAALSLGP